jgi:hypothetical protein
VTWIGRTIKNAVAARLNAAGDTTPHYLGAAHLASNHAPPRYVWVGRVDSPSKLISKTGTNPPAIYTFEEGLECHCWGRRATATDSLELDYDAAYQLSRNVLTALRMELGADLSVQQSGFLRPAKEGLTDHGQVYVLNIAILVPSVAAIAPTVEISGYGPSVVAGFPAGDYTVIA